MTEHITQPMAEFYRERALQSEADLAQARQRITGLETKLQVWRTTADWNIHIDDHGCGGDCDESVRLYNLIPTDHGSATGDQP